MIMACVGTDIFGADTDKVQANRRLAQVDEAVEHAGAKFQGIYWHPFVDTMK